MKLFVITKISYLQPFREIMRGENSVTTNNKQTTNKQQTTNTTDDHNSPSGFFQNPGANNIVSNRWYYIGYNCSLGLGITTTEEINKCLCINVFVPHQKRKDSSPYVR